MSVVRSSRTLRAPVALIAALLVGALLGALAVLIDEVPVERARLFLAFVSTGLSWGAAAIMLGAASRERVVAGVAGLVVLGAAVGTYYLLNHQMGLRDTTGQALLRAGQLWGLAALIGGPVLGSLGWSMRFGNRQEGSIALGVLCGLLLGQGLRWAIVYGLSPHPVLTPALLLPLIIFAIGVRGRSMPYALGGLAVSAIASAGVWTVLESIG